MPRTSARRASGSGFTVQIGCVGFAVSFSIAPFGLRLVTWTRRLTAEPYLLLARTAGGRRLSWTRLTERTPPRRA